MRAFAFEDKTGVSETQRQRRFEYKSLSDGEVAELVRQYKEEGNIKARNKVVLHFQRLMLTVAAKQYPRIYRLADMDDLLNEGSIGIIEAIEKFEPDIASFPTYAWSRIRRFLGEYFLKFGDTVALKSSGYKDKFSTGLVRGVSIEDLIPTDDGESFEDPLAQFGFFQEPHEIEEHVRLGPILDASLLLNDLERKILKLCAQEDVTPIKIGKQLGMQAERVRRIRNLAIRKLKAEFAQKQKVEHTRARGSDDSVNRFY